MPIDNFSESYHVNALHPQQLPFVDEVNVLYEPIGIHSWEVVRSGVMSPRLRGSVDQQEVLAAMTEALVATFHKGGSEERRAEAEAIATLTVPPGGTARQVICDLKRKQLEAVGVDVSPYPDEQLIDGYGLAIFPNTAMFVNLGEVFIFRTRPNGNDPDSCIAELINLEFPTPGEDRPRIEVQEVPDWSAYDWGTVIEQDLRCFGEVQAGMHSRAFRGLRLSAYQESRLRNMHRALGQYVETPALKPGGGS